MRDMTTHSICLIKLYQITMRKKFDFLFLTTLSSINSGLNFHNFHPLFRYLHPYHCPGTLSLLSSYSSTSTWESRPSSYQTQTLAKNSSMFGSFTESFIVTKNKDHFTTQTDTSKLELYFPMTSYMLSYIKRKLNNQGIV